MLKKFIIMLLATAFVVSCASKKKKGEDVASDVDANKAIDSFDPRGSDSGNIPGLSTVNFAYDSAVIDSSSREQLKENAEWIKARSSTTVQVEGHCDSRGSIEYNLSLGERRARAVKNYLVNLGVPSSQLNVISYGEERLLTEGDSESAHAQNRRANFVPISN